MAAAALDGDDAASRQREGTAPVGGAAPAPGASADLLRLVLEAVICVLEGVAVAGAGLLGPQAGQALQGAESKNSKVIHLRRRSAPGSERPPTSHALSAPPVPFHRREIKKPITVRQRTSSAAITRPRSAMSPGRYPMVEGDWVATAAEANSSTFRRCMETPRKWRQSHMISPGKT